MKCIKSELLGKFDNLSHGFINNTNFLNLSGVSSKFSFNDIITINQIHSDNIYIHDDLKGNLGEIEGDSIITNKRRTAIGVYTADCVPILIYEKINGFVSTVHAGWKGSLKEITKKSLNKLNSLITSKENDYYAIIGPSIGKCCYEVGYDVASQFMSKFNDYEYFLYKIGNEKYLLDLVEINRRQLINSGVQNIEVVDLCTKCNDNLPSYRRQGESAGRILSFIGLL